MRFGRWLRRYWPETLLFMAVALPWLSLFALGLVWLWQGGRVWVWALAAAALGLLAWPLSVSVRRRANEEARLALGDLASCRARAMLRCASRWRTGRNGGCGDRRCAVQKCPPSVHLSI
jgi:hypothetical protein